MGLVDDLGERFAVVVLFEDVHLHFTFEEVGVALGVLAGDTGDGGTQLPEPTMATLCFFCEPEADADEDEEEDDMAAVWTMYRDGSVRR